MQLKLKIKQNIWLVHVPKDTHFCGGICACLKGLTAFYPCLEFNTPCGSFEKATPIFSERRKWGEKIAKVSEGGGAASSVPKFRRRERNAAAHNLEQKAKKEKSKLFFSSQQFLFKDIGFDQQHDFLLVCLFVKSILYKYRYRDVNLWGMFLDYFCLGKCKWLQLCASVHTVNLRI